MPDHKEMGRQPTEREREIAFEPHESPSRQADGDPGRKPRPGIEPQGDTEDDGAEEAEAQDEAGQRATPR